MTNPAHYSTKSAAELIHPSPSSVSWWQRQSIRFKTTILAIAIGTIPTMAVGSIAYYFAANSVEQQSSELRKTLVGELQDRVDFFMSERFNDIQMMATLPIFSDPQLRQVATPAEKSAALQQIQNAYGVYNSIAVFDAMGNVVAQTEGQPLGNHFNRGYVQDALKTNGAVISQPRISTSSGIFSIYTASPIKDRATNETIGFVRARIPVEALRQLLQGYTTKNSQYYLLNNEGEIFLGSNGEYVVKIKSDRSDVGDRSYDYEATQANQLFDGTTKLFDSIDLATEVAVNTKTNTEQFLAFAPEKQVEGLPELNWQAIVATDTAIVFAPQRRLRRVFLLGTGLVALGVGAIASTLANRFSYPILRAASVVQNIGRGDFEARVQLPGTDEFAQLGNDINRMAAQLANLLETQTLLARQSESIKNITLQLATADDLSEILETAVIESFQTLNADRIIYYQFKSDRTGEVVVECVAPDYTSVKGKDILNSDLVAEYYERYERGEVQVEVTNNSQSAAEQLKLLQVNASLTAPVIIDDELDGLAIAYQHFTLRSWLNEEVEFLSQVANQVGFAATRLKLVEQQKLAEIREKSAKEAIQSRALSLLQEVYDVSEGDLTIRARVTEDEIGTIADSYNSTIESLQRLVNQTKLAAMEVQLNTSANDLAVQSLAQAAVTQATEIARISQQVQKMEQSSGLISTQAVQAENLVEQANLTIDRGDETMDLTVAKIGLVQNTVRQTATKVEKLGESSQEISQAVNLIARFAAQTHLLALKASIEAARAGEQGKGFAVIAAEVRSLATQSAEATAEIETLVNKIQLETSEVVEAMNQGTAQITSGNQLVQQTRQSLTQVSRVSQEIGKLVDSITQATQQQSATSAEVSQTIVNVAAIAGDNSQSATKLSGSIRQLSEIATKLQSDIDKFKT